MQSIKKKAAVKTVNRQDRKTSKQEQEFNMAVQKYFADIILPLPLSKLYTYLVPHAFIEQVTCGKRVLVQFGSKKYYTGIIKTIHQRMPDARSIKPILAVIDDSLVVTGIQLKIWEWMANYYLCGIGDVYKAALPSGLKMESESKLVINPEFMQADSLTGDEMILYQLVHDRNVASIKEIIQIFGHRNASENIKSLVNKQAMIVQEVINDGYKPKLETFIRLNEKYQDAAHLQEALESLNKAPAQKNLFMAYLSIIQEKHQGKYDEVLKTELLERAGTTGPTLKSLIEKGYFVSRKKRVNRLFREITEVEPLKKLTDSQSAALEQIRKSFSEGKVTLLHGITSSGKTEIYIHLIHEQLIKNRQVLYLLPEIALTSQIISRLRKVFGNQVVIYHSRFTDNERVETYNRVKDEQALLVLGVRSSVFLPFRSLGLVIVDEEHENTYKQFDPAPRYHARDASIILAGLHQAKVLLGSATPSLESYYNVLTDKYSLVSLFTRYQGIQLPEVKIADLFRARKRKQMVSLFAPELYNAIQEALNNQEQVILFQNRRGFSPFIECLDCNYIPHCKHCDVTLTYHKKINRLICHYCGFSRNTPAQCPACSSTKIETRGFGTEKIADEIQLIFSDAKIARMDLDTTRKKDAYENIITAFEDHKIDILIGTQMITKGLDFDKVSLVGILNADNMFNFPDFRAFERSYQLISQVSGRAGRKKKQGRVVIQTSNPDHPVIQHVLKDDFEKMVQEQMAERRQFKYPPFVRLIKIVVKHKDSGQLKEVSNALVRRLNIDFRGSILGPQSPLVGRMKNWYLMHIFIKLKKDEELPEKKERLRKLIDSFLSEKGRSSTQIYADVDPQ